MSSYAPSTGATGLHYRKEAVAAVSSAATLSVIATSSLLLYVFIFTLRLRFGKNVEASTSRLMFWRTQFGTLFLNLVLSDLLQAIGFAWGWYWIGIDKFPELKEGNVMCSMQGVLIQAGDVASAIWAVVIALHTAGILVARYKPSNAVLGSVVGLTWAAVVFLTMIGPAVIQTQEKGPFYSAAGNWCWIQREYDSWRLWLHYLLLFIAAALNTIIYLIIYLKLRREENVWASIAPRKPREEAMIAAAETQAISKIRGMDASEAKVANHVARRMLIFPVAYLITIVPLSSFRIAGLLGHDWGYIANAACGCVFTLAGLINVLVFSTTRRFFQRRSRANKDPFEKTCGQDARRGSRLFGAADKLVHPFSSTSRSTHDMISLPQARSSFIFSSMGSVYPLSGGSVGGGPGSPTTSSKGSFAFDDRVGTGSMTELVMPSDSVSSRGGSQGRYGERERERERGQMKSSPLSKMVVPPETIAAMGLATWRGPRPSDYVSSPTSHSAGSASGSGSKAAAGSRTGTHSTSSSLSQGMSLASQRITANPSAVAAASRVRDEFMFVVTEPDDDDTWAKYEKLR